MVAGKSHKESQGSMLLGAYPFASAAEAPDETSGPWRLLLPPWANVPSPVSTHELVVVGMLEHSAKTRDGSSHSGAMSGAVLSSEEKLHEGLDRRVTPRGSVVKALHESAQPWQRRCYPCAGSTRHQRRRCFPSRAGAGLGCYHASCWRRESHAAPTQRNTCRC